jgi:hypothetical protein
MVGPFLERTVMEVALLFGNGELKRSLELLIF